MMYQKSFCSVLLGLSAVCLSLTGCETTSLSKPSLAYSCGELDVAADREIKENALPFMYTQLCFPGDWRAVQRNPSGISRWVKEGSLRRILVAKQEYFQLEGLSFDAEAKQQGHHRFRIASADCQKLAEPVTLYVLNFAEDDPNPYEVKRTANLKGTEAHDSIARILCGYQAVPELDEIEKLAQKWRSCHQPQ